MGRPAQTDPQFKIRLPSELKERLEGAAEAGSRTVTTEIVARLQDSFDAPNFRELLINVTRAFELADEIKDIRAKHIGQLQREVELLESMSANLGMISARYFRAVASAAQGDASHLDTLLEEHRNDDPDVKRIERLVSSKFVTGWSQKPEEEGADGSAEPPKST
jgi:hypothetical protein